MRDGEYPLISLGVSSALVLLLWVGLVTLSPLTWGETIASGWFGRILGICAMIATILLIAEISDVIDQLIVEVVG